MSTASATRARASSTPSRHVYDVAVVGGQLAGAAAACLLAKRGYSVLYVEHDGMGPGYTHDGWLLPYAPFVMPPLKAVPSLEAIAAEVGLTTTLQRAVLPCEPALQLVRPGLRFQLATDATALAQEALRTGQSEGLPKAVNDRAHASDATTAFLGEAEELPPDGMMARFRFNRLVGKHPGLTAERPSGGGPALELLDGLAPFLSHLDVASGGLGSRPLALTLQGPHGLLGGREALREQLLLRLKELGGDVLVHDESTVVESLAYEGATLTGIKLARSEQVYRASAVIAATDAGALRRLVPDKKKHRDLVEALDSVSLKRFSFAVNWVLPEKALPRGLGALALWESGDEDLGTVLLQVSPARKAASPAPLEHERVLCAAALVPATAREVGEEHLEKLAARFHGVLEKLLPFSRKHVLLESAPYVDASGVRGSRLLPHPLVALEEAPLLGIGGLNPRAPGKHLFLCSREVFPGLGLEGEFLAAQRVAGLVRETFKKHDPLKRA